MPHLIIEYAREIEDSLDPRELMQTVQNSALATQLFDASAVKTRARAYSSHINAGDYQYFIHVTARILSGRSDEQKHALSSQILSDLIKLRLRDISLSVEVCDLHQPSYAKQVL